MTKALKIQPNRLFSRLFIITYGTPSGVRTLDTLVETIVEIQTFSDDKALKLQSQINSEKFSYSYLNCDKVATKWRHFMQKKTGLNPAFDSIRFSFENHFRLL